MLDGMYCVKGQIPPDGCLPGTRQGVTDEVVRWFSQPASSEREGSRCGKSTIARSISDLFKDQYRCASFFFNASNQAQEGPDRLFSTLSRQLSDVNQGWKACLVEILNRSMTTRESRIVQTQFEEPLLGPARQLDNLGSILIVIDALDESGSPQDRQKLMATLKRLTELPPQFRFFIGSGPETDIERAFGDKA